MQTDADCRDDAKSARVVRRSVGKIVYAADVDDVYRSMDSGKPGTSEHVLQ